MPNGSSDRGMARYRRLAMYRLTLKICPPRIAKPCYFFFNLARGLRHDVEACCIGWITKTVGSTYDTEFAAPSRTVPRLEQLGRYSATCTPTRTSMTIFFLSSNHLFLSDGRTRKTKKNVICFFRRIVFADGRTRKHSLKVGTAIINPKGLNAEGGVYPDEVYANFPVMLRKLALIYALVSAIGATGIRAPPAAPKTGKNNGKVEAAPGSTVGQSLRDRRFWLLWFMVGEREAALERGRILSCLCMCVFLFVFVFYGGVFWYIRCGSTA